MFFLLEMISLPIQWLESSESQAAQSVCFLLPSNRSDDNIPSVAAPFSNSKINSFWTTLTLDCFVICILARAFRICNRNWMYTSVLNVLGVCSALKNNDNFILSESIGMHLSTITINVTVRHSVYRIKSTSNATGTCSRINGEMLLQTETRFLQCIIIQRVKCIL